ncbi:MAG: amino acid adenylation domain-containing protein [Acidobacteriota bacterium]
MQQGMLFHSLNEKGSGVDIVQEISDLNEDLDVDAFEEAWRRVAARHPMMRTSFEWERSGEPLQRAHPMSLRLDRRDWRMLPAHEQDAQFEEFLRTDRRQDFAMDRAPLMRLVLVRMGGAAYRFAWTFHHALFDGWCIPIVWKEVFAAYDALRAGRELEFPPVRPYRDYVDWLGGIDRAASESFWRRLLAGVRGPTALEAIRPPGDSRDGGLGEEELRLSESLTSSLRSVVEGHGLTWNTLVQGAWACLLGRYAGEEEVVFGATMQCRPKALTGSESMVGLFINTLPMRARVAADRPFLDLVKDLRAQWVDIREFKHTPLVDVQGWSDVPRGTPLFESLVVFEPALVNTGLRSQGGPWLNRTFRYVSQPNTPLNFLAYGEPELILRIAFDGSRFDRASIRRMLGHLATMLEAVARDVRTPLGALPLLTPPERTDLLAWSSPRGRHSSEQPIHAAVELAARRSPGAVAVDCQGSQLTYAELDSRANRLARHLRGLGVGPEVLVGVCLERSIELVVALLAVLKAGGAYVPLDPAYPPERLAFTMEDSQARVLITNASLQEAGGAGDGVRVCLLDRNAEAIAREDGTPLNLPVSPDDLAYVIYTSGSTGKPKGVLVTHRNVDRLFAATAGWFHFDERDVWSLFHSSAFDFSVWEMWGALRHGGRLAIVEPWMTRSPESFREWLAESGVTVLNLTPSAFRHLIAADAASATNLRLRWVILGGEALDPGMLSPWFDRHGADAPAVVNMYGITETTVHVTFHRISRADADRRESVIGRPIPDLDVFVLDRHGELCPVGVPGEIHVGGPGVARGYLQRPDLTAERFVRSPLTSNGEGRLYRSGDLARYAPNGDLEYLGRIDHQVKIRGYRVELGEIETALARHPSVGDCAVVAVEEEPGDVRLVAAVVYRGEEPPAAELRSHLKRSLPAHMIPSAFRAVERIPRTPSGKADRRAVLPAGAERAGRPAVARGVNETERMIADIWGQVLGVEDLGPDDDFFERGGHSLLATRIVSRIRDAFGVEVPMRALFDSSTVSEFAEVVSSNSKAGSFDDPIRRLDRESHRAGEKF